MLFLDSTFDISRLSLYPERLTEGTVIIDSMGPNRNKEDIVISNQQGCEYIMSGQVG